MAKKKQKKKITKKKTAKRKTKKTAARKKPAKRKLAKKNTAKKKTAKKKKTTKKKTAAKRKTQAKKKTSSSRKTKKRTTRKPTKKTTSRKTPTKAKSKTKTAKAQKEATLQPLTLVGGKEMSHRPQIQQGDVAPQFMAPNQKGELISLESLRGKTVILYFYPKDDTPGCTREACSFRDHLPNIEGKNAVVLGVSFDSPETHQKFIEKYGLNFDLLSDENKEVAEAYGVYVQKNMYGKTYWGIERSTFVIGPDGRLQAVFRNVKVDGHTDQVMDALSQVA